MSRQHLTRHLQFGLTAAALCFAGLQPVLAAEVQHTDPLCGNARSVQGNGQDCTGPRKPVQAAQSDPGLASAPDTGVALSAQRPWWKKRIKVDRCSYPANTCR